MTKAKTMANFNYNRRSYNTQMDRDYYTDPKKGFDKAWHNKNKKAKLNEQLKKIQALRKGK